jgi:hypothetical protein
MTTVSLDQVLNQLNRTRKIENQIFRKYKSEDSNINLVEIKAKREKKVEHVIIVDPLGAYLQHQTVNDIKNTEERSSSSDKLFDYKPFDVKEDNSNEQVEEACDCPACTDTRSDDIGQESASNSDVYDESEQEYETEATDSDEIEISLNDEFKTSSISNAINSFMRLTVKNPMEFTTKINNVKSFTTDRLAILKKQIQKQLPNSISQQELTNRIKSSLSGYTFNSSFMAFNGNISNNSSKIGTNLDKDNGK